MKLLKFSSKILLLNMGLVFLISCGKKQKSLHEKSTNNSVDSVKVYSEKFRPQFHFSPPEKWMNDPNGLVYHKGVYHLFYQFYPDDIVWGPMHWGHAVSNDLIHWKHKPIALYPDKHGLIFSGSAVVDKKNTSGFGTEENPPLVAIFTYHLTEGEKAGRIDFQTQGIAYSLDNGYTWKKYKGNPVIGNDGIKDFRDPKVFWHEDTKRWIMALVAGDHAKFYESTNLKEWNHISDFGKNNGAHGGVWECPDLFKLKVEGSDEEKWVLLISINPGAPNGGSGTQYFIGDFDGKQFKVEHTDIKWIDYGTDNYAGVTYNNIPNGDRIFIGWMSNWNYARNTPTEVWRSAMTLPRKLTLHKQSDSYFLKNYPIETFHKQLELIKEEKEILIDGVYKLDQLSFNEMTLSFKMNLNDFLNVSLKNDLAEELLLTIDPDTSQITLDRRKSGITDFETSFGSNIHKQPFHAQDKEVNVFIALDKSSVEVFIDKGRYVFTDQIFPNKDYSALELTSKETMKLNDLKVLKVNTIWNEK